MPYWRLSSFYFFYFGALGVIVPFWGLYLKGRGFDALAIGQLMAIPMATKIVAPYLWGWLGDHLGHRMAIVRAGSLVTAIIFAGVFWTRGFWDLALVMVLFSFFWNAVLPQVEVITFRYLGAAVPRYARIRVWGSIGFILTVVVLGSVIDHTGAVVVPLALLAMYVGIWLATVVVPEPAEVEHPTGHSSILAVLRTPTVLAFLGAAFLMQAGHGVYYSFFSIFLVDAGWSKTLIGLLWALGVAVEVLIFLWMHRLLDRFGARRVLIASLVAAALRWLATGYFPESLVVILLAQASHALTFGAFHASAIHLTHHYFTGRLQGRGQALYSSVSFGAGGAIGSLACGMAWDGLGPVFTFEVAALVSAMGVFLAVRWVRDPAPEGPVVGCLPGSVP